MTKKKSTSKITKGDEIKIVIKRHIILAAVTLAGVGLLQWAFAAGYMYAFHQPKAHNVPVGVVGEKSETKKVAKALKKASKDAYKPVEFTSLGKAKSELKNQELYAIYQPKEEASLIVVASANSYVLANEAPPTLEKFDKAMKAEVIEQQAEAAVEENPVAAQAIQQEAEQTPIPTPQVEDIAKPPKSDPQGTALFYLAFSAVFGAYLAATALNMVRGKRKFNREALLVRTAAFAAFAVVTSILVANVAVNGVHALPQDKFWHVVGVLSLTSFGVSMFTSAVVSLIGVVGTALAIVFFVIIGNPASGGPMALILTGEGPWHLMANQLPTGPAIDAIRQIVYFKGVNLMQHLWTPIVYAVIGFVVLFIYGFRRSSITPYDSGIAEDVNESKK